MSALANWPRPGERECVCMRVYRDLGKEEWLDSVFVQPEQRQLWAGSGEESIRVSASGESKQRGRMKGEVAGQLRQSRLCEEEGCC